MKLSVAAARCWLLVLSGIASSAAADSSANPARPRADAHGNPIRYAASGHVSNYDESKVGPITLPELLVLNDGRRVQDARMWEQQRRTELLALYEKEVLGAVPARVPKVTWTVAETVTDALAGKATCKRVVLTFGEGAQTVSVTLRLYLPTGASGPLPALLHLTFYSNAAELPSAAEATKLPSWARPTEVGPVAEMLARGYAYAVVRYTDIQPDNATTHASGVGRLAYTEGQDKPRPGEWGTIAVWAWAMSRVLDYFETERTVDARRVGLVGFSRLGKTALWAGACDPRFALIFAACSGEMGASLSRRDYGETIDDVAQNFPWWLTDRFQKYVGRWNELPVDAHTLLALAAPRPVFLTAGTQDQWADPRGMFQAAVAAEPAYGLYGKAGIGTTELPATDRPLVGGQIGFLYHTGPHVITAADWTTFLDFADRHLQWTQKPAR